MRDNQLIFSDDQAVSGATQVASTNILYFPQVKNGQWDTVNDRPGGGGKVYLNLIVGTTGFQSSGSNKACDVSLYVHTSSTNVTTTGDKILTIPMTVDTAGANFPAGKKIATVSIPNGQLKPYMQLAFNAPDTNVSSGKLHGFLGVVHQEGT